MVEVSPDVRRLVGWSWGGSVTRMPMTRNLRPAVVALGQEGVVSATHQPDVGHAVVAAQAERVPMVEFQLVALPTSSALLVHVAASPAVALTHGTPDGCGDAT